MGIWVLIVGSAIALIGIFKDNRAKGRERSFIPGLNLIGSVLAVLAILGLGFGSWKSYDDGVVARTQQIQLQNRLKMASRERDLALEKLKRINIQLKQHEVVIGFMSKDVDQATPYDRNKLTDNGDLEWSTESWYAFPIVNREDVFQSLRVQVGDELTVNFEYTGIQDVYGMWGGRYGYYFNRHVRYGSGPFAALDIGNKVYLLYRQPLSILIESPDGNRDIESTELMEVKVILPSEPPHLGLEDIKLTVKHTKYFTSVSQK